MAKRRRDRVAGRFLEAHGNKWRVVVRVPPSLVAIVGKTQLKETLKASTRAEADTEKWTVLARLRRIIDDAKAGRAQTPDRTSIGPSPSRTRKTIASDALEWRREMERERRQLASGEIDGDDLVFHPMVEWHEHRLDEEHGFHALALFRNVVAGRATPFDHLEDDWFREARVAGRTEAAYRKAMRDLASWCDGNATPLTVEAITKQVAGRFIKERFIDRSAAPATANKAITGLSSFWSWMEKRGHTDQPNPWIRQSLSKPKRSPTGRDPAEQGKRAFTDDEVATLLAGLKGDLLMADFCRVAALTGMRRDEIAGLRVRHLANGIIKVPGTKTAASAREVPMHSALSSLMQRRTVGKAPNAYIFDELPDQQRVARGRGAPVSQAFTRERRRLGVDDRLPGERQSRVDFHSFRRWFGATVQRALERGAGGFTDWTLSDVLGHSREQPKGGMTMGRYAGRSDLEAMRACVEAVRLPPSDFQVLATTAT